MGRYTFIKHKDQDNPFDITNVYIEVDTVSRPDLEDAFNEFLLACGYALGEEDKE